MPIQVDIRKTFLYKWGKEEGLKEGEQRGLTKGLKQGKREGLKEGISGIIQVKFGSQRAKQIKNILDKINDINRLEKIKKEVIRAKTWEDFIKFLKNPNSKNKNSKGN
jgi:flagellar biosynthesis/type III secretory pathway protein FliH